MMDPASAHLQELLPLCVATGVSVKYGRKVLQRLEAVGPARAALLQATAVAEGEALSSANLAAALQAAKVCRSLLQDDLLSKVG